MKKVLMALLGLTTTSLVSTHSFAQYGPFAQEIKQFKKKDSTHRPPKQAVLFIGSSTFTKWTDIQSYFPEDSVINRGFGGATLKDVIDNLSFVAYPYDPRQIFIYCGDNDLVANDSVKAVDVIARGRMIYHMLHNKFPETQIDFLSIKYSPSRKNVWKKIAAVNAGLKKFYDAEPKAHYIDITHPMRNGKKGIVDTTLFGPDMLHMNAEGYKIWQKTLLPFIIKQSR